MQEEIQIIAFCIIVAVQVINYIDFYQTGML
jgi:hypothetical protein